MNPIDKILGKKKTNMFSMLGRNKSTSSIARQNQWKQMTAPQRRVAIARYPDLDRYSRNMGQDGSVSVNKIPYKFIYIKSPTEANYVTKLMGWKDFNAFSIETGINFNDIKNTFFDIADYSPPRGINVYSAADVKRSGKSIMLVSGNPSRVNIQSFDDYMSIYYYVDNGKYYEK